MIVAGRVARCSVAEEALHSYRYIRATTLRFGYRAETRPIRFTNSCHQGFMSQRFAAWISMRDRGVRLLPIDGAQARGNHHQEFQLGYGDVARG